MYMPLRELKQLLLVEEKRAGCLQLEPIWIWRRGGRGGAGQRAAALTCVCLQTKTTGWPPSWNSLLWSQWRISWCPAAAGSPTTSSSTSLSPSSPTRPAKVRLELLGPCLPGRAHLLQSADLCYWQAILRHLSGFNIVWAHLYPLSHGAGARAGMGTVSSWVKFGTAPEVIFCTSCHLSVSFPGVFPPQYLRGG